jgi:murein DD-endopeptidase MepM/ murein hydrolase activator NlpD
MFTTPVMGVFLTSLLWFGLSAVGPAVDGVRGGGKVDEGPTIEEIDAVLSSARREFALDHVGLMLPVEGIAASQLVDTYNASRSGGRSHNALDIMAPRGSLVVSATDGVVEQLHHSSLGGITAYVRSLDGNWVYYYAHLDSYAPGLANGQHLQRGDPIGRVGSTGNANAAWPHLHFAVYRMAPGARWYQGQAIDPYPLLAGNARRR